jgi:hypothetical protein
MPICTAEAALLCSGRAEELAAVRTRRGARFASFAELQVVMYPGHRHFQSAAFLVQALDGTDGRFFGKGIEFGSQRFGKKQFRDGLATVLTGLPLVFRGYGESGMLGHGIAISNRVL